jgi:predicted transcriptional regulator
MPGEKIMNKLTVGIANREKVSARFIEAFETGKPQGASINFENERLLWNILTLERWDILRALTGAEPMTVHELAKRVDRNETTVLADVEVLLNTGFLEKAEGTKFIFPYDAVHVDFVLKAA